MPLSIEFPRSHGTSADRTQFETIVAEISANFIHLDDGEVDSAIEDALRAVCVHLDIDLSTLWQWASDKPGTMIMTHLYRPFGGAPTPDRMEASEQFPWTLTQVMSGKINVLDSIDDLPVEAVIDRENWKRYELLSTLNVPLSTGSAPPFGVISFNMVRRPFQWLEPLVQRLAFVGQIIASALIRKKRFEELQLQQVRLSLAAESARIGLWSLDCETNSFWMTDSARELFGFQAEGVIALDDFLGLVHAEDRDLVDQSIARIIKSKVDSGVDYRVVLEGGVEHWMSSRGRLQRSPGSSGDMAIMGVTMDITGRKRSEEKLQQALEDVQRLTDQLHKENLYLKEQVSAEAGHLKILGNSEPVRRMLTMVKKVAPTDAAVLLIGETGTGKELLAEAIHSGSTRREKTMIKVNCAALPPTLIEGELFGREKGAYTGAMTRHMGRFEMANGSTIFLDEIGDLPLELQAKLLRVLEDGTFERLGSNVTIHSNIRLIAATNRDLAAMMEEGKFRGDLFHRLNVFPIEVPPLRNRISDIPLLVWNFIFELNQKMGRSIDTIPKSTMEELKQYRWPGNVRELRNIIERAMILSDGNSLKINLLQSKAEPCLKLVSLEEVERAHITKVLEQTHWRVSGPSGAAQILDMLPTTLHSRMKKLGIVRDANPK